MLRPSRAPSPVGACSSVLVALLTLPSCIGVSQKRRPTTTTKTDDAVVNRCRGETKAAADGMVDDFEDANSQLTNLDNRDGYWWKANDAFGSTIEFQIEEKGADGSALALHATGTTLTGGDDTWGAQIGVNLVSAPAGQYDAGKHAGISFKAKVGPASGESVRFKIGDANTHKGGGICTACWNLFGKDLKLTTEWKEYKILFSAVQQLPGWGSPRPLSVAPDKLIAINWTVLPGQTFDLWIDDVVFLTCP